MVIDDSCKVFVGNVPFKCTKKEFINCFKNYDGFINADIIHQYNSNKSRGFGFICFDSPNNANKFINNQSNIILKDRILRFSKYMSVDKTIVNRKFDDRNFLFVKNVPPSYKTENIINIFKKYSKLGSCFINTDMNTGKSKESAIVEILDNDCFKFLLSKKNIVHNGITLHLSKWKQRIKIKNNMSRISYTKLVNNII